MDRPFLQTPEWLAFQKSLGRTVWRLDDGFVKANIIRHDVRFGQNFLYVPYGPELNLDLATEGLRNEIRHFTAFLKGLARQQKSMFVKLEPTHDMVVELFMRNGMRLRKSKRHMQPMFTVVADLTQTEDQLLDALHHKHRYNINLAERKGVTVEESRDAGAFWKMLEQTAERDLFRTHGAHYYQKLLTAFAAPDGALRTRLFFALHGGRPVAGVLMMEHGKTVSYVHGASDREHRALMAPHLLHWALMRQYKAQGFKWYDFWGIDSQKWPGVTRFKLGFGAKLIEYPGSFDYVVRPFWTWAYNL
ncbi:MAG: peptidoglycan bridge formation glycyltransferase FemA/FemB family protein [Candidatus Yanofskybacteria bacterium]|nr:peptidoglycan bridge formation glycyltransferase FemA/FemB family protein [Candidatus Yanofskybacteria bacterium]